MASFPARFSGSVALHPLTISTRYPVAVLKYDDFSEQRWVESGVLKAFVLELDGITKADKDAIEDFFDTTKGGFDKTWDITVGGTLYSNMAFDTDTFSASQSEPELWRVTLPCKQVRKN